MKFGFGTIYGPYRVLSSGRGNGCSCSTIFDIEGITVKLPDVPQLQMHCIFGNIKNRYIAVRIVAADLYLRPWVLIVT